MKPSLRANVVLLVLAMLLLPQAIVVAWSAMERDIGGRLRQSTSEAANEAAAAMSAPDPEAALDAIAEARGVRIRVATLDGEERLDLDHDTGTDLVHQIGTLFFGPDGAPTLRELDETLGPLPRRGEVREALARPGEVQTGCRKSAGDKLLVCHAVRTVHRDEVVYVQESSRRAVRALYDLRYQLARLTVVMLPFALAFSWWMGRRMVRPIEWLRARVLEKARSESARGDLQPPPDDEVGDLARAFNDLLDALDERRRANEAVAADLVHELKNPVAAIRACAESLEKGGVDEKKAARLAKILADSSGRLDALVSQFLELARAEAGMPNERRTEVDMGALARGIVSSVEPAFPDVTFAVEAEEDANVIGVPPRLDSVVRNLVDNAASFSGEGARVRVDVRRDGDRVVVEVTDDGPGIAEDDLARVFDRFFTTRSGAARGKRGTGLGLALVKAVAEAHGGEASARGAPGRGAIFRVALPAA